MYLYQKDEHLVQVGEVRTDFNKETQLLLKVVPKVDFLDEASDQVTSLSPMVLKTQGTVVRWGGSHDQ